MALSVPACSCWAHQDCKALTTLYLGHFSRLRLQRTLEDKVVSSMQILPPTPQPNIYYKSGQCLKLDIPWL